MLGQYAILSSLNSFFSFILLNVSDAYKVSQVAKHFVFQGLTKNTLFVSLKGSCECLGSALSEFETKCFVICLFCRALNVLVGCVIILFGTYSLFNMEPKDIYTFCSQTSPAPVSSLNDSVISRGRPQEETDQGQRVLPRSRCYDSDFDDLNKFKRINSDASF